MNRSNVYASTDPIHLLLDIFFMVASLGITALIWGSYLDMHGWTMVLAQAVSFITIYMLANRAANVYNVTLFFYHDRMIKKVTSSFLLATLCAGLNYYFTLRTILPLRYFLTFIGIAYVFLLLEIKIFRGLIDRLVNRKYVPRCIYVGSKASYNKFRYFMQKTTMLVNEIGYVSVEDNDPSLEYIGSLSQLEKIIRNYNIDQVFFLQKREMDTKEIQQYIDLCIEMGVTCRIVVDIYRRRKAFSYNSSIGTYPVITFHTVSLNKGERLVKRIFDIVFSIILIILSSPIMLITAIAIKIDSPGPVLFKQVRVGQNGSHFKIWKFRSMYIDAEARKKELIELNEVKDGMMFKIQDDPRITRVGKFIRKFSIDEIPQFFNVLFGAMSFVGTRPPTLDEVEAYKTSHWRRLSIKPGITGMWQVSGRSNIKDFDEVVRLDTQYIDEWSMLLDIKLVLKTVAVVLSHKDAY